MIHTCQRFGRWPCYGIVSNPWPWRALASVASRDTHTHTPARTNIQTVFYTFVKQLCYSLNPAVLFCYTKLLYKLSWARACVWMSQPKSQTCSYINMLYYMTYIYIMLYSIHIRILLYYTVYATRWYTVCHAAASTVSAYAQADAGRSRK